MGFHIFLHAKLYFSWIFSGYDEEIQFILHSLAFECISLSLGRWKLRKFMKFNTKCQYFHDFQMGPSLQAVRAETMVDGLPRAYRFAGPWGGSF